VSHIASRLWEGDVPKQINFTREAKTNRFWRNCHVFCRFSVWVISVNYHHFDRSDNGFAKTRTAVHFFFPEKKKIEWVCNSETLTVMFLRLRNYVFPPGCGYHDNCLQHVEQITPRFSFLINYVNYSFMQTPGMLRKFSLA